MIKILNQKYYKCTCCTCETIMMFQLEDINTEQRIDEENIDYVACPICGYRIETNVKKKIEDDMCKRYGLYDR